MVALAVPQEGPKRKSVPDSETAIATGEAALIPVYGKKKIESERSFSATLKDDVWTVAGTLYGQDGKPQLTSHRHASVERQSCGFRGRARISFR